MEDTSMVAQNNPAQFAQWINALQQLKLGSPFPKFVRDGLGRYTGEGFRGGQPRVTHGHLPGRTRSEKRALLTHAQKLELRINR